MKSQLIAVIIISNLLVFSSCSNQTQYNNNTNLTIPDDFEVIEHNTNLDEILALQYKNEMQVRISINSSKTIKKGALYGYGLFQIAMKAKFSRLVEKFKGENLSEFRTNTLGNRVYMYQTFDFKPNKTLGYYEYGGLYIEQPEEYYEFFISGNKAKQKSHRKLIDKLIKGIR